MSREVDDELLARFVLRETTSAEDAFVHARVAEDPAWAEALRVQAQLDLVIHEALDELASRAPEVAPVTAPWWKRWRAWLVPAVPALALATALLVLRTPPPSTVTYELDVVGGESIERGDADEALRFTEGSTMSLVLRAASPTDARPDISVTLDGAPLEGVDVRLAPGGSVQISGRFGDTLALPAPGAHVLTVHAAGEDHDVPFLFEAAR